MTQKALMILVLAPFFICQAFAGGDPAKGQANFALCVACHAASGEGNKTMNSPSIAGQEDWYLVRQLQYFKDGIRGANPKDPIGLTMRPMAMTLTTPEVVADVAAYVKSLKPVKHERTLDGDAAKGKALYAVCTACHGPDGKGMQPMNSPNLLLQQDWYLFKQLKDFKDGIRGTDPKDIPGQQMRPMAMTLPDDQAIKDVIAYIQTLH